MSTPTAAGRRRSQRLTSSSKRSQYFDDEGSDSSDPIQRDVSKYSRPLRGTAQSDDDFESNDDMNHQQSSDASADAEELLVPASSASRKRGRPPTRAVVKTVEHGSINSRKRGRPAKSAPTKAVRGARRDSTDSASGKEGNSSGDDDERPTVEFIPLPQLRSLGGVEYRPHAVHPNTMEFLKDLKANNKRNWLKNNDPEYRRSLKDWESFVESVTEKLIDIDDTIPELPLKDVIFRIYRDIRFSKDPTPYKPHYSASWSRTGRKGPYACYYVHCEPGSCFVGGGLWHPDKDALARMRASIDERPHRLKRILIKPEFRRAFLPNAKGDEKSVVAAFAESNQENALRTKPKGFHPEHRDLELLKLRNYTIGRKIKDSDLTSEDAAERMMAIFRPMVEYVTFINRVVCPDPDDDDDDTEEEN